MMEETSIERMRAYTERMHAGQRRQDGTPAATHVARVARILAAALQKTDEASGDAAETLRLAAFGHDLLEDTEATSAEITAIAGTEALSYIEALTNRFGDDNPRPYADQVRAGPEEARLIKLCDMTDNLFQASMSIGSLGTTWMKSFFLPIVDPMLANLSRTAFVKYPRTAADLLAAVSIAREHLDESIAAYDHEPWGSAR